MYKFNFCSPELKAQVSFSDWKLSVGGGIVVVLNFSHVHSILKNHSANFNQTHRESVGEGDSICKNEGPSTFPRGDNKEIAKIHWPNFKIFFWTTGSFSTKLDTKHPWVMGSQFCSNEGLRLFQKGDNKEIGKIHWRILKIYFSRTTGPISTKVDTNFQVCSSKGPALFQGEIIREYR